jgi:ATP-binding cassette subfamily C protein CydD
VVALAALGSSATIVIAWQLSWFISQVFVEQATVQLAISALIWVLFAGGIKAAIIWLQELLAQRAANAVKIELRGKLFDAITQLGPAWLARKKMAEVNILATSGLEAIDPYFSKYLPQLVYTALITPVFVLLIWLADPLSGVVLILTLPLIPIFMMLIGWATSAVQQAQLDSLNRLSSHFLEVLRGLTTLRVFRRAHSQVEIMDQVSEQHRSKTMKVLRISFLSGFALELAGSVSVALIAVSIGLRLVDGSMGLFIGLYVLILAPEAYLPIRQVGAHFHAASEGLTASQGVLNIIDEAAIQRSTKVASTTDKRQFSSGHLTVLTGPSGAGKSTIFRQLLSFDTDGDSIEAAAERAKISWLPQSSGLFLGSVQENIVGPDLVDQHALSQSIQMAALDDLSLEVTVGVAGASISGGQAQRVALARTFYRALTKNTQMLLLDEPISALDEARATKVISALKFLANEGRTVVAISHQQALIKAADLVEDVRVA